MDRAYWRYFVFTCVMAPLHLSLTSATPCGTVLTATSEKKLLTSQGYPIKYEPSQTCSWTIQTSDPSMNVVLEMVDVMIQPSTDCVDDSVSIYDGNSNTATKLDTLCGDSRVFLASTGQNLYLEFRSNDNLETRGFQFRYYEGDRTTLCTFTFTATRDVKTFYSPGYPIDYFNNLTCQYSIQTADASDSVRLEFTDVDVQSADSCRYDSIGVTNTISGGDDPVATICGTVASRYQGGNNMKVVFISDVSKVNKGFSAEYRSVPKEDCSMQVEATDTDSFIMSPGYPTQYFSNLICRWTIVAMDNDAVVELTAVASNIADTSTSCSSDRVTVMNSDTTELGTFCGTNTPTYESNGPNMTVIFTTDGSNQATGFRLKYKQKQVTPTSSSCGGTLTASTREQLLSPGYPRAYLRSQTCTWTITALNESFVNLYVDDIDVEVGDECLLDSLKIYDGGSSSSPHLRTLCGQLKGYRLQSTGNVMTLVFTTDDSNNGRGFEVSYQQASTELKCSETLKAADTYSYITSPQYPNPFPGNSSCTTYKIGGESGLKYRIKLEVLESDLPEPVNGECTSDYIMVFDGPFSTSAPLKSINTQKSRFCGKELPTFVSPALMMVQFHSTQATTNSKFRMRYKQGIFADEFVSPCGGTLTATDDIQNITSPNYPDDYRGFLNCTWTITTTDSTKMVRLTSRNFQLLLWPYPYNCDAQFTWLKIYDGYANTTNYDYECSRQALMLRQSSQNIMAVELHVSGFSKAFSLQYIQTAEIVPCDYVKDIGSFGTLRFPGNVQGPVRGGTCSWLIRRTSVEENKHMKLTINSTALIKSPNCTQDFIRVYDGQSSASPLIGLFCGEEASVVLVYGQHILINASLAEKRSFEISYSTDLNFLATLTRYAYSDKNGIITSVNYPFNYPRNAEIVWTIKTIGERVVVEVMSSEIEASEGCINDRVEVHDGESKNGKLLGKFCGTNTPSYESSEESLAVVLISNDNDITGKGFQIKYYEKVSITGYIIGGVVGGGVGIIMFAVIAFISVKRPCQSRYPKRNAQATYVNKH
ncbi:cubilin-like [Haliotis asinina]|uniref:cubilin-like n=1 Tax=Haliotis asinina TaxID=109174 RepID=UPI0035318530